MDEKNLKNNYSKLVLDFISTIRKATFYPSRHPVVTSSIKDLHWALSEILKVKTTLTLDITPDNKILIEGEAIDSKSTVIEKQMKYLKKSNIENLTFISGISEGELQELVKIMLLDAAQIEESGDIKKILLEHNIQHVQINQFSYIKIEKDKEALVEKIGVSTLDALKSKIKDFSSGKIENPQEIESIETDIFGIVIAEFKEKQGISPPTKSILKKFLSHCLDIETGLLKLKNRLLETGNAGEKVDGFMQKLEGGLFKKTAKEKKTGAEEYEKTTRENQELESKLAQIQGELAKKTALMETMERQAKLISDEKERVDNIVHNMTDGLVVVDPEGKILMVNPAAETLLGVSTKDTGKQIKDVVRDEHLLALVKNLSSGRGEVIEKDVELFSPNESTIRVLRASSAVVEDQNGKTVGMVAILNDITKQKEVEKLKTDFVAKVSHEIRTPLIAMEKSLELILSKATGPLSEEQDKFLAITERNLKRLTLLINDLLDLSKLEAGKVQLVREPVAIEKVIDEPIAVFKNWAQTKAIRIEKRIQEGLPQLNIDANRIIQVINNLMGNAIKFTPDNGTITVDALLAEDKEIQISLKDTGIGISEEELPKVFNKFYQVSGNLKTDIRGTGIGLTIAKEIVELHGGRIWAESEVGRGAKFIFTLPLKDNMDSQGAHS